MQVTSHSCMQEEARSRHHGLSVWIGLVSTHMPSLSVPQARVLVHDVGQSWRGPDTAALVCAASHPSCTRRLRRPHPPVAGRAMGTQGSNGREQTCPAGQIVSGFRATEQADFLSTLEFECSPITGMTGLKDYSPMPVLFELPVGGRRNPAMQCVDYGASAFSVAVTRSGGGT